MQMRYLTEIYVFETKFYQIKYIINQHLGVKSQVPSYVYVYETDRGSRKVLTQNN